MSKDICFQFFFCLFAFRGPSSKVGPCSDRCAQKFVLERIHRKTLLRWVSIDSSSEVIEEQSVVFKSICCCSQLELRGVKEDKHFMKSAS